MYYDTVSSLKRMARQTQTRFLVRKYAQQIHEQGGTPTLAMLKRMLGNKGSPNTILDELRKWQEDTGAKGASEKPASVATPAGPPAPAFGGVDPAEMASLAAQLREAGTALRAAQMLPELVQSLTGQFDALAQKMTADRDWMQKELELMNSRFEAVQRRALLQIDEARGEASRWREKHQQLQSEFGTWKETNRQRSQKLMDENAWLRGKLGLPVAGSVGAPIPVAASSGAVSNPVYAQPTARRQVTYPGHPRAIGGPGDE